MEVARTGEDLISRASAGDAAAFMALVDPLWGPAYRLAFAMLQQREAAEDAVQEAALNAWRHRERLRTDTRDLRPWFLTIVANQCRSMRRSPWWRALRRPDLDVHRPDGTSQEDRADLHRALLRLREDQRTALALYYYLDLPMEEVAAVLGISVSAAKNRVHRAVKALRPAIQEVT